MVNGYSTKKCVSAFTPVKNSSSSARVVFVLWTSLIISPFCRITIREQTSVTWSKSWLEIRNVLPCTAANSLIIFRSLNCEVGSRLANGSSKIRISGLPIYAPTTPTFFWFPLERSRMNFFFPRISSLKNSLKFDKNPPMSFAFIPRNSPIKLKYSSGVR